MPYYRPSSGPRRSNVRNGDKDGGGDMEGPRECDLREAGKDKCESRGNPKWLQKG